jgi:PEP-CTERM motif
MSFMKRMESGTWKVALTAAIALAASVVISGRASAVNDLNAGWTFEAPGFMPAVPVSVLAGQPGPSAFADGGTPANIGTATAKGVHAAATTMTTPVGNGSTQSYSTNVWSVGDYYQFQTSTTGATNIGFQVEQTGSGTGPRDFKIQYSTDNITYTDGGTYSLSGPSWSSAAPISPPQSDTYAFDFSSITALNNQPSVYFRLTDTSTTSITGGTVGTAGSGRIDNVGIYSNFDITQPPIIGPTTPPVLPQANDVVLGVSNASAKLTIGLLRGPATANGGASTATFSGWQSNAFIQYVSYDNLGGSAHNVHGNLLGVDSGSASTNQTTGVTTVTGGAIYNLATQGSLPFASSQTLVSPTAVPSNRLGQIAVSPLNNKVAVAGADNGQVIVWDYTAGNSQGAGAALNGIRSTTTTPLTGAITTVVGMTTTVTAQRQGVTWIDNNSVLSLSTGGNLNLIDATSMAVTPKGSVTVAGLTQASTDLEYNPAISKYVWGLYGAFNPGPGSSSNMIFVFDPANNFNLVKTIDLTGTTGTTSAHITTPAGAVPTANSLAFDSAGDLFIAGNAGIVSVIPNAAPLMANNPAGLTDFSALRWATGTFANFSGMDIGLAGAAPPSVSGDYNGNGVVDMADYVLWRKGGPLLNDPTPGVQAADYDYWRSRFGATTGSGSGLGSSAVPEPASALLMLLGFAAFACKRRS